jgi:predicted permease
MAMEEVLETTLSVAQASTFTMILRPVLIMLLQAAISVLLVIGYGAAAQKYDILTKEGEQVCIVSSTLSLCICLLNRGPFHTQHISHLAITLFLPALLFSEIGPHASPGNLASC